MVVVSATPVGTVASPGHPQPPKHDPGDGFFMRHQFSRFAKTAFGKFPASSTPSRRDTSTAGPAALFGADT